MYNTIALIKHQKQGQQSNIEYLFNKITDGQYIYKHHLSPKDNSIELLAITHPRAINLANIYNRVFTLDYTYNTNIYDIPLLQVIGHTPTKQTFLMGIIFMDHKNKDYYIWCLHTLFQKWLPISNNTLLITNRDLALLTAIQTLFPRTPHLLYIWHINKAVNKRAKREIQLLDPKDIPKINGNIIEEPEQNKQFNTFMQE